MQQRKRLTISLLLLMMAAVLVEPQHTNPMHLQRMHYRPRYPRRDNYVAYNLHKTIQPRDVNELDANQARKAMVDVQQTIAEVQSLLAKDPTLPRLTRGEIEELFENVTREEFDKSLREGDQSRAQHMRALMLVLPYNTNNMSPENIKNIYNLPPVTKVVQNEVDLEGQQPSKIIPNAASATQSTNSRRKATTTAIPVTTIRFTTLKPTTFHPALPNVIRDEVKPSHIKPKLVSTTTTTEFPVKIVEYVTKAVEPTADNAPTKIELPISTTEVTGKNKEISDILASLGFGDGVPPTFRPLPIEMTTPFGMADLTTETTSPKASAPNMADEELRMLLRTFGLLNDGGNSVGIGPLRGDYLLPETLSEIQPSHLVQNDGLKVEELEPSPPIMAKPDIRPDDYVAFKPLPMDAPKLDKGLDELLKSFGIIDNGERKQKSLKSETSAISAVSEMEEMPMIDKDLVPQMASVLDNLGIQTMKKDRNGRKLDISKESDGAEMKSNGLAVFRLRKKSEKPPKAEKLVNEDYRKLEQLWETIRELEKLNPNLTEESLESLNLKNYNLSESLLAQGPNPLESYDVNRINDVKKRQQPTTEDTPTRISLDLSASSNSSTNSSNSSNQVEIISTTTGDQPRSTILDVESDADTPSANSTTTSATDTASSSDASDNSARFSALEESFGGGADPVAEEPLPPPRRNGFYFLADWNSFLEVGEDPNKVVISFRPQAGDPSRFLPVNVP
ncbi:uncharacterized protein LOC134227385 isoform X2 [Armigeres subalbatus]